MAGIMNYLNSPMDMQQMYQPPNRMSVLAAGLQDLAMNMQGRQGGSLNSIQQNAVANSALAEKARQARLKTEQAEEQRKARQQIAAQIAAQHPDKPYLQGMIASGMDIPEWAAPSGFKPTTMMRNIQATGLEPGTLAFESAMQRQLSKPGTTINVGGGGPKLPAGYMWQNPDVPTQGVQPIPGGPVTQATQQEAKELGAFDASADMLDRMEGLVDSNPNMRLFGIMGQATDLATEATPYGAIANKAMELVGGGELSDAESEMMSLSEQLSNQLTAAVRGAAVGPQEQAKFEKQLPRPGQPEKTFRQNLKNTRRNLNILGDRRNKERNLTDKPSTVSMSMEEGDSLQSKIMDVSAAGYSVGLAENYTNLKDVPAGMVIITPNGKMVKDGKLFTLE